MSEQKVMFKFSDSFMRNFDHDMKAYSDTFFKLNDILKGKGKYSVLHDYGMYNSDYRMRLITPSNISEFADYLIKSFKNQLISANYADLEKFSVTYVKKALSEGEFAPLDTTDEFGNYVAVDYQQLSLNELIILLENEKFCPKAISAGEAKIRRDEVLKSDFKTIEDLHFTAVMKNIVKHFEDVINSSCSYCDWEFICRKLFSEYMEKFMLFSIRMNTITLVRMIQYTLPDEIYYTTDETCYGGNISECCMMLKTNEYQLVHRLPFNCNIRDVVLKDTTPDFEDIIAALDFIMTDDRSPISYLVRKHMSPDTKRVLPSSPEHLAKMFMIVDPNCNKFNCCKEEDKRSYYEKCNDLLFNTEDGWLDKIAYGTNPLNGNWREDALGNNKESSILNSVNMIYRLFNTNDLTTNNELSDQLINLTGLMEGLIHAWRNHQIDDWFMTKDILCVLGEIFTRTMLKLYHNNDQTYICSDKMTDTMIPGMMYEESALIYQEAEATTNTTQNNQSETKIEIPNANGTKTVTAQTTPEKIKAAIQKFINWVTENLAKFSDKFKAEHQAQIDYIMKHKALNDEIGAAMDKDFGVNVTDFYLMPSSDSATFTNELTSPNIADFVTKALNDVKSGNNPRDYHEIFKDFEQVIKKQDDTFMEGKEFTDAIKKHFIRGEAINGKLTSQMWNKLIIQIQLCPIAIESVTKTYQTQLSNAMKDIESNCTNTDENPNISSGADSIRQNVNTFNNTYVLTIVNELKNMFNELYKNYKEIVDGYNRWKAANGQAQQPNVNPVTPA